MLSRRENEVLELIAHGLAAEEIADRFCRSTETVKKTVSNIKEKLRLQKATELTAYYWCNAFGVSFEQRRNAILSIFILIAFSFSNPLDEQTARRASRNGKRKNRIELIKSK